jgi:hypothetical protein
MSHGRALNLFRAAGTKQEGEAEAIRQKKEVLVKTWQQFDGNFVRMKMNRKSDFATPFAH